MNIYNFFIVFLNDIYEYALKIITIDSKKNYLEIGWYSTTYLLKLNSRYNSKKRDNWLYSFL